MGWVSVPTEGCWRRVAMRRTWRVALQTIAVQFKFGTLIRQTPPIKNSPRLRSSSREVSLHFPGHRTVADSHPPTTPKWFSCGTSPAFHQPSPVANCCGYRSTESILFRSNSVRTAVPSLCPKETARKSWMRSSATLRNIHHNSCRRSTPELLAEQRRRRITDCAPRFVFMMVVGTLQRRPTVNIFDRTSNKTGLKVERGSWAMIHPNWVSGKVPNRSSRKMVGFRTR